MGTEPDRAGATIAEMPAVLAENCPGSTAFVVDGGAAVTFADLAGQVRALAADLAGAGLSPGSRVLAWTDPSLDYLRLLLAASQAGLAIIPVDADCPAPAAGALAERLGAAASYTGGRLPDAVVTAGAAPVIPAAGLAQAPLLIVPDDRDPAGGRAAVVTQRAAKSMGRLNAIAFRLPLRGALVWPAYPGGLAAFTAAALTHLHVGASIEITAPAAYRPSLAASPPGGLAYAHAGAVRGGIIDALRDPPGLGTIYLPVTAAGPAQAGLAASRTAGQDQVLLRGWNPAEHGLALVAGWRGHADLPEHQSGLPALGQLMPDVEARLTGGAGSGGTLELRSPALMAGYAGTGPALPAGAYFGTGRPAAIAAGGLLYAEPGQEIAP
jgi:hypothetical protein